MPRASENPIGSVWSITVDGVTPERTRILADIDGIIVVSHQRGRKSQNPHYHIYYESPGPKKKEWVKEYLLESEEWKGVFTKEPKTNYRFSTDPDYTIESYWKYVWANRWKEQQFLVWNHDQDELEIPENKELPVISFFKNDQTETPGFYTKIEHIKNVKRKTTEEKLEEFYTRAVKPYYEENPGEEVTRSGVKEIFYDHFKGGKQKLQALQMYADYAIFRLCEDGGESTKDKARYFKNRWLSDSEKFYPD